MKTVKLIAVLLILSAIIKAQSPVSVIRHLPVYEVPQSVPADWLLDNSNYKAGIYTSADKKTLTMANGLLERTFTIAPDVACISYRNLTSGQQMLRAVSPEAVVTIDLIEYPVGGLEGQTERAYLKPEWVATMTAPDNEFELADIRISDIQPYVNWKPGRWCGQTGLPTGKTLTFLYASTKTSRLKNVTVAVHYELYDGIPLMNKWVEVLNNSQSSLVVNKIVSERLALVEEESAVVGKPEVMLKPHYLYVETKLRLQ